MSAIVRVVFLYSSNTSAFLFWCIKKYCDDMLNSLLPIFLFSPQWLSLAFFFPQELYKWKALLEEAYSHCWPLCGVCGTSFQSPPPSYLCPFWHYCLTVQTIYKLAIPATLVLTSCSCMRVIEKSWFFFLSLIFKVYNTIYCLFFSLILDIWSCFDTICIVKSAI